MNSKSLVIKRKLIWQKMWRHYQDDFYQKIRLGRSLPLQHAKVTLFFMISYNSENSINDFRPFSVHFCHSSVVMYISSPLQQWHSNETCLPNITEISPPNLAGFIRPCCELHWQKNSFIYYTHLEYWWHNRRMPRKIFEKRKQWPYNRKTSHHFQDFADECSFSKRDIVKILQVTACMGKLNRKSDVFRF